jgi:LysW-gamma-L-alpha-aminoadipyl-6-phosphate/LysW-L-glutamyl-5-phosphate reductase
MTNGIPASGAKIRAAVLHGAGYGGGVLVKILSRHPAVSLDVVTSRSFAGKPVWTAHPALRGASELAFADDDQLPLDRLDVLFVAAEHGQSARTVAEVLDRGYQGAVIDLSADFRFRDPEIYPRMFGFEHPRPELLAEFTYGLTEARAPYAEGTRFIANPGCFATAIELALLPLARRDSPFRASITALTGASGSGARPKDTTHFPTREGNVRAYKVFTHQHEPEMRAVLGEHVELSFVPVSGPWTHGIWGTAHVTGIESGDVRAAYETFYRDSPLVRLWDGLPELRFSVGSPFCDLGVVEVDGQVVIGFALDNLWKGAASQAIQNMNLLFALDETTGLV